jgi:hypothetical protein
MTDHIQLIRRQEQEARLTAAANYQKLAEDMARGEKPPADALAILSAAGRTPDNLEQAVRAARERQALEPLAAAFGQILIERGKADGDLNAAVAACEAELQAVHAMVEAKLAPLRQRVEQLREAEQESRTAKIRLEHLAAKPGDARRNVPALTIDGE